MRRLLGRFENSRHPATTGLNDALCAFAYSVHIDRNRASVYAVVSNPPLEMGIACAGDPGRERPLMPDWHTQAERARPCRQQVRLASLAGAQRSPVRASDAASAMSSLKSSRGI